MLSTRSIILVATIILGLTLQWGHNYTFLIRYALMAMLFLSWVDSEVSWRTLSHPKLWSLVGMMAGLAVVSFAGFSLVDPQLALIAALLAITPTALAAPVVTSLLQGQVEFVTASVLITNGLVSLTLPLVLPMLLGQGANQSGQTMLLNTSMVVILPLTLAQGIRYWLPGYTYKLKQWKPVTFYLWLVGLYLASAKAGFFIRQQEQSWTMLALVAVVALVLCSLNFGLGRWLGRPSLVQESGQALGQKNTMLAVWVCLTFLSPTLALGPMFYIIFQNIYNAYLLSQMPHR
jgi:BASS family bile acid:Na+ symporter